MAASFGVHRERELQRTPKRKLADNLPSRESEALPRAVVATDSASANADCDNGAVALYGAPRYGRGDERATHPLDTKQGNRVEHALDVQHPT